MSEDWDHRTLIAAQGLRPMMARCRPIEGDGQACEGAELTPAVTAWADAPPGSLGTPPCCATREVPRAQIAHLRVGGQATGLCRDRDPRSSAWFRSRGSSINAGCRFFRGKMPPGPLELGVDIRTRQTRHID